VKIHLYRPGLVHAKTVTVDDELAIVGSANLDLRSFNLNFELSVVLYGPLAAKQVRLMQHKYESQSDRVDLAQWQARSAMRRHFERAVALLAPLL
jgi:cardiolipin synthase